MEHRSAEWSAWRLAVAGRIESLRRAIIRLEGGGNSHEHGARERVERMRGHLEESREWLEDLS